MKLHLRLLLALLLAVALRADGITAAEKSPGKSDQAEAPEENMEAQPMLIKITAMVDGSGRIVFTRDGAHYEHKTWDEPTEVTFGGEPWTDLSATPAAWSQAVAHLDLTKAWIVKRKGRDTIALELTPDGFDLYLCDAPNGASLYEVTLAIPRRR